MARLIDFHGNCSCGRDAHVSGDVDDDGNLRVQLETSGGRCGQVTMLRPDVGQVMAPLRDQAIDDEAEATEADDLEPVATSAPAATPTAPPRRGRPPRAGGGG